MSRWSTNVFFADSIDSIDSKDSIDSRDSIDSIDSVDSINFIDSIDSIDSILVPHKRLPAFTPHTKGTRDNTDGGGAFGTAPIGSSIFPLCVV